MATWVVIVDTDGNAEYQIDRFADDGQNLVTVDAEGTAKHYSTPHTCYYILTPSARTTVLLPWGPSRLRLWPAISRCRCGELHRSASPWASGCTAGLPDVGMFRPVTSLPART